jgi:hypothetical protein
MWKILYQFRKENCDLGQHHSRLSHDRYLDIELPAYSVHLKHLLFQKGVVVIIICSQLRGNNEGISDLKSQRWLL